MNQGDAKWPHGERMRTTTILLVAACLMTTILPTAVAEEPASEPEQSVEVPSTDKCVAINPQASPPVAVYECSS